MPVDEVGYMLNGQPELAEQLMRGLELKGDLPQSIDPRLQVGITSLDLTAVEYRHLRRTKQYVTGTAIAALAANFSMLVIGPPTATPSGVTLMVTQRIRIFNNTAVAQGYRVGISVVAPGALPNASGGQVDGRQGVVNFSAMQQIGTQQVAALIASFGAAAGQVINANSFADVPQQFILVDSTPMWLVIQPDAVNLPLTATVEWTERQLLSTEK